MSRPIFVALCVAAALAAAPRAQNPVAPANDAQAPFRIFGDTYYVGTFSISSILITSRGGHVLIDGAFPESAADIAAHITALGFRLKDVKAILNSHVHADHAGGIAALQARTGAAVYALPWSAQALASGRKGAGDPQFDTDTPPPPAVKKVRTIEDGQTLRIGDTRITARKTAGHTPGGTTWTWLSCERNACADMVYADSLTAVSADGFRFTDSSTYPHAVDDFKRSFTVLRSVDCHILLTPHPDASHFWERVARRATGTENALMDRTQCARYADDAERQLQARIASENPSP